jgi:hypothetical protein
VHLAHCVGKAAMAELNLHPTAFPKIEAACPKFDEEQIATPNPCSRMIHSPIRSMAGVRSNVFFIGHEMPFLDHFFRVLECSSFSFTAITPPAFFGCT